MTPERFFRRPGKKETLALKQELKRRRLNHLRSRLSEFSPQWWLGIGEGLGILALFLTNLWLLWPFFGAQDKHNVFSAPVIPVLTIPTDLFIPYSYGVRLCLLIFLILFPLSFYYFVREITGRKLAGFLASFIVSLPTGFFLALRVKLGVLEADGAQIVSLTLTPLVCLLLLRFLRQGSFWMGVFSALGITLVALTSPLGLVILSVFAGIITFSEMLLGRGRIKLIRFVLVLILAAGFSSFWYNPKFVILTLQSPEGQVLRKTFANLLPLSFFLFPLLGIFGFLLFENRAQLQPVFIAFFLTICFGLFSLGAGVGQSASSRFLPTFGVSFAFLVGLLTVWLFDFLRASPKLKRLKVILPYRGQVAFGLIGLLSVALVLIIIFASRSLWQLEETLVLGLTAEQRVGIWEIREQTTRFESFFGYVITVLTSVGVAILKTKLGM